MSRDLSGLSADDSKMILDFDKLRDNADKLLKLSEVVAAGKRVPADRTVAPPIIHAIQLLDDYDKATNQAEKDEILKKMCEKKGSIQILQGQVKAIKDAHAKLEHPLIQPHRQEALHHHIKEHNKRSAFIFDDHIRIVTLGGVRTARQQWYDQLHEKLDPNGIVAFLALLMDIFGPSEHPDALLMRALSKTCDDFNKKSTDRRYSIGIASDGDYVLMCHKRDKDGKLVSEKIEEADRLQFQVSMRDNLEAEKAKLSKNNRLWADGLQIAEFQDFANAMAKMGPGDATGPSAGPSAPPAAGTTAASAPAIDTPSPTAAATETDSDPRRLSVPGGAIATGRDRSGSVESTASNPGSPP